MHVIGLDPGVHTGVAHYCNGKLARLETIAPLHIRAFIMGQDPDLVVFEDSRLTSPVFSATGSRAASMKIARNVGEIDAWCKLIEAACHEAQVKCVGISPKAKGAKLGAVEFARVTGWDKASNQHGRDAAMCAWAMRNAREVA